MTKSITTYSIDSEVLNKFQMMYPSGERSEIINNFLTGLINQAEARPQIDYMLLKARLSQLDKTLSEVQGERQTVLQDITTIEKRKQQDDIQRLEREKAVMESQNKCQNCGHDVLDKDPKRFNIGLICQACFKGMSGAQFKHWSKPKVVA